MKAVSCTSPLFKSHGYISPDSQDWAKSHWPGFGWVLVLSGVLQAILIPVLLQALVTGSSWDVSCRAETHSLEGRPPLPRLLLVRVCPQTVRRVAHQDSRLQLWPSQGKFILKLFVQGPAVENPASFEALASWLLPAGPFRVQVSSSWLPLPSPDVKLWYQGN